MKGKLPYLSVALALFFVLPTGLAAQEVDSVKQTPTTLSPKTDSVFVVDDTVARHSPRKAALLSLAVPGGGQIYNKKYWKLPIVYGGLGGLSFWLGRNVVQFRGYRNAYRLEVDEDPTTSGSFRGISDASQLKIRRDQYKQQMDLSAVLIGVFYLLHIVDATVDAHLMEYDISENLTMKVQPTLLPNAGYAAVAPGLTLTIQP